MEIARAGSDDGAVVAGRYAVLAHMVIALWALVHVAMVMEETGACFVAAETTRFMHNCDEYDVVVVRSCD